MKIQILIALLAVPTFTACTSGVNFEVVNNSGATVDSVVFSNGFDNVTIKSLAPEAASTAALVFSDKPKGDGHYLVKSYASAKEVKTTFGYYTNGSPGNEIFTINLYKDSIKVTP